METQRSERTLLIGILLSLIAVLVVQVYVLTLSIQDKEQRQVAVDYVLGAIQEVEKQRVAVFTDYVKDLESYETKSIYHQIYHANNAQLKLQNLLIQENQLITTLIAGKR